MQLLKQACCGGVQVQYEPQDLLQKQRQWLRWKLAAAVGVRASARHSSEPRGVPRAQCPSVLVGELLDERVDEWAFGGFPPEEQVALPLVVENEGPAGRRWGERNGRGQIRGGYGSKMPGQVIVSVDVIMLDLLRVGLAHGVAPLTLTSKAPTWEGV